MSSSPGGSTVYHAMDNYNQDEERKESSQHRENRIDLTAPHLAQSPGPHHHSQSSAASPDRNVQHHPLSHHQPSPSEVSHVNFHTADDVMPDEENQRLSPRKDTLDDSSQEHSRAAPFQYPNANVPVSAAAASSSSSSSHSSAIQVDTSKPAVMIAFINFHSGGKTGESLSLDLIKVLGREYVFDLKGDKGPARGLRLFKGTPNLRVVIGGGDGTINWVLSQMRMEGMTDVPAGTIPLGTGNDSSRAFGWGFKYPGVSGVKKNIERMRACKVSDMVRYDRWHTFATYDRPPTAEWLDSLPASVRPIRDEADIPEFYRHPETSPHLLPVPAGGTDQAVQKAHAKAHTKHEIPHVTRAATMDVDAREQGYNVEAINMEERDGAASSPSAPKQATPLIKSSPDQGPGRYFGSEWNNYLSWGVDAQIQNSFHHQRESCRACFCCRPCNMGWMGLHGAFNFCCCQGSTLDVTIEVRDEHGTWVTLPLPAGLKSVILLNTPTYAGGRPLWGKESSKSKEWECPSSVQAANDGLFEIVGVTSTFHLGMIMIQFSRGIRLAQVNEARLTFGTAVIAQADGEPYLEQPSTIHIRPLRPSTLMTRPEKTLVKPRI